jgi:hypothetical protein
VSRRLSQHRPWGYIWGWGYSCSDGCGYGYGAFGPFPYGFYPYGLDSRPYYRHHNYSLYNPGWFYRH